MLFPKHHTLNQDSGIQNPFLTKKRGKHVHHTPSNKQNNQRHQRKEKYGIQSFFSENCLNGQETTKRSDWP